MLVKRGKLKFKGDDDSGGGNKKNATNTTNTSTGNVLKKKRTTHSEEITTTTTTTTTNFDDSKITETTTQPTTATTKQEGVEANNSTNSNNSNDNNNNNNSTTQVFEPKLGTGRFTSSGTIVYGSYTKFMDELSPGDAIIITHPTSLRDEMKVVRIVVSNISLSISSPFSTDLISTTPFRFIKAPKDSTSGENDVSKSRLALLASKNKDKDSEEYSSQGGQVFTYRSKKDGAFGGYKIVTEKVDTNKSREELLEMRSQKKSDRFCY